MENWPKRKRDAVGRKVRTQREMQNNHIRIPEGTILTVTRYFTDEVDLVGAACPRCKISSFIRKVPIWGLDLLPVEDPAEAATLLATVRQLVEARIATDIAFAAALMRDRWTREQAAWAIVGAIDSQALADVDVPVEMAVAAFAEALAMPLPTIGE